MIIIVKVLCIAAYIILLAVPFFSAYVVRKYFKGISGFCLVVFLSSLLMSGVVIALWLGYDWYLEFKIASLDRNGDGSWSESEIDTWTAEDHRIMNVYIGDGGRNVFAAIIFPMFSVAYSLIVTSVYWIVAIFRVRQNV